MPRVRRRNLSSSSPASSMSSRHGPRRAPRGGTQYHVERCAALRKHRIDGFQDVVALDHALYAGDGDRLDLRTLEAELGLRVAHRSDRGMRGGVARIALQDRGRDNKVLAEAGPQFGLVPFRAEHPEKPELAF